jgi:hypothetical protein
MSFQQIMMRLTLAPVVLASIIGLLGFRYRPRNLRYLAAGIFGFILPLELLVFLLLSLQRNNLFISPIYTVGELWLLALVYQHTLCSAAFTRLVPWLVGGFACYALFDSVRTSALAQFQPGQQVLQSILVLLMVGLYFRKLLNDLVVINLWQEPMFWVSVGLCIYFLGYLQIALFSNYLLNYSRQLNMNVWAVHSLLFIVLYLCYCRALWLPPRN